MNRIDGMKRSRLVTTLVIVVGLAIVTTRTARAAPGQTVDLLLGLGNRYDTNILQYSDAQIETFEAGTRPYRFSIRTRDDFSWNPYATLSWEREGARGRRHGLRVSGQGNYHQKNGLADYGSVSAGWRESFGEGRRFMASYYRLPRYYLRQLFDPDVAVAFPGLSKSRYHHAEFQLDIASVAWSQRIAGKNRVEVEYQFERRGYNPDFRERDSGVHQGTARWSAARVPRRGSFAIFAGYRSARARGGSYRDPLSAPSETLAAYPDVSYHGLVSGLNAGIEIARSRRWRLGADLAYELETRVFDSSHASDRFHYGRNDILSVVEAGLRVSARRHWSARGSYRWEDNRASLGTDGASGSDPGSYRVQQGTLAVEWSGSIWRRAAAPEFMDEP